MPDHSAHSLLFAAVASVAEDLLLITSPSVPLLPNSLPSILDRLSTLLALSPNPPLAASVLPLPQTLVNCIPFIYDAVRKRAQLVFHVIADSADNDYSHFAAMRDTGAVLLATCPDHESVADAVVLAHAIAKAVELPVVHFVGNNQNALSDVLPTLDRDAATRFLQSLKSTPIAPSVAPSVVSTPVMGYSPALSIAPSAAAAASPTASVSAALANTQLSELPPFIKRHDGAEVDQAKVLSAILEINQKLARPVPLFDYSGAPDATSVVIVLGSTSFNVESAINSLVADSKKVGVLRVRLYRPFSDRHVLAALPASVTKIAVFETCRFLSTPLSPLFVDVATAFNSGGWHATPPVIREARPEGDAASVTPEMIVKAVTLLSLSNPPVFFGAAQPTATPAPQIKEVAASSAVTPDNVEGPYIKLLEQVFANRLVIANVAGHESVWGGAGSGSAEVGFGRLLVLIQNQQRLTTLIQSLTSEKSPVNLPKPLVQSLHDWLRLPANAKSDKVLAAASEVEKHLVAIPPPAIYDGPLAELLRLRHHFRKPALWLVGGDRLAYDIGNSGVHHLVSSKQPVNMLVLDTQPYSEKVSGISATGDVRKKDIGLYAMSYGGVYVASIALNASYAQALRSIMEAEAYPGPSIVLAYSPRVGADASNTGYESLVANKRFATSVSGPLTALKETKQAVDSGYWPLYRWNPSSEEGFSLDSERIRKELKQFLEKENQLALVIKSKGPEYGVGIDASASETVRKVAERKVQDSYAALLGSLNAVPLTILYGSDGGNAENVSKKIAAEAKGRGLRVRMSTMNDEAVEDLAKETNVLFVVSTAGQGEFPINSKELWRSLAQMQKGGAVDLSNVQYAVFAMGDSHYWPLPEDAVYFAKSGKDLDAKLEALGAKRAVEAGIGDDQDPDGYMTGYHAFLPKVWEFLGVGEVEVSATPGALGPPSDDAIKESSNYLRGTIKEGLEDRSTGALAEYDTKLTKFHGIYMQDDRDIREQRTRQGLEPAFSFMIRVRVPGGVATPAQWLRMDEIADTYANGTIKVTTRQAFQFHGVVKGKLKKTMQEINQCLMDTIAACGDVNRNVMCNPNPDISELHAEVYEFAKAFSEHLTPRTSAYHEIWLDKQLVAGGEDHEPLYGKTYLPRKFKTAIAVPPSNDVDVFAHDLGYIAIVDPATKKLIGYNVTVGGGMGMTHGNKKTYPVLAQVLGFATPEQAITVGEKVMLVQRDYGDRTNRKHARLKYTIEDRGLDWFRREVETLLGYKLAPAKPYEFTHNGDRYGWTRSEHTGRWHYTLFVQNGRVRDYVSTNAKGSSAPRYKTGLHAIATQLKRDGNGELRLTPNQHVMISNLTDAQRTQVAGLLKEYGLSNEGRGLATLHSMACVALPTCGLAMAESERYLPDLVEMIEDVMEECGLDRIKDAITVRMTGCPNGCARPALAEIGFVGKAPGAYNMYLGGSFRGDRLNKLYAESLGEKEILEALRPVLKRYALERNGAEEKFGDFVTRVGIVKHGKNFHD
ncbi:sulfite reductase beta subunit [Cladochytrium replicatum]|nr:sulfite reductase beta subunit [Cladochytrium replicatum]